MAKNSNLKKYVGWGVIALGVIAFIMFLLPNAVYSNELTNPENYSGFQTMFGEVSKTSNNQ
ncbi:MAG: hypothetical protein MJ072_04070, partial [Clostridia bacterium]|nr:hypothetical protein [Clostridia bacterium]